MADGKISSVEAFDADGKNSLYLWITSWLQQEMRRLDVRTTGGGSGVTEITSDDGSITVTNPTGPVVDLAWVPLTHVVFFDQSAQSDTYLASALTGNVTVANGYGTQKYGLYWNLTGTDAQTWMNSKGAQFYRSLVNFQVEISPDGSFSSSDTSYTLFNVSGDACAITAFAGRDGGGGEANLTLQGTDSGFIAATLGVAPSGYCAFTARDDGWDFVRADEAGDVTINLRAGKTLTVKDHSGNPIFRVAENGDLHGKTGKALTFDL